MMNKRQYAEFVHQTAPKTEQFKTLLAAFMTGGLICCIGQGINDLFSSLSPALEKDTVAGLVSITMIFLGALFTGIGIYDDIGNVAGAGSIIPITGFANSIVAPAMEFKKEGIIFGICSKMFVIAGPIIVLGVFSSFLSGLYALLIL